MPVVAKLFNSDGTEQGQIDLEESVFGISANAHAMYEAEKMYRANQRQGTASAQTRSEVSYTGKKMFRQKGLGRARMGSRRSPVRIGGGRAHGPSPAATGTRYRRRCGASRSSPCFRPARRAVPCS